MALLRRRGVGVRGGTSLPGLLIDYNPLFTASMAFKTTIGRSALAGHADMAGSARQGGYVHTPTGYHMRKLKVASRKNVILPGEEAGRTWEYRVVKTTRTGGTLGQRGHCDLQMTSEVKF